MSCIFIFFQIFFARVPPRFARIFHRVLPEFGGATARPIPPAIQLLRPCAWFTCTATAVVTVMLYYTVSPSL